MFRARTVFVVGAGASIEVGMPVGSTLLETIVKLTEIRFDRWQQVQGSPAVTEALKRSLVNQDDTEEINRHLEAGWQLAKSAKLALSIDNLIDALEDPKVELMGKIGIAQAILEAEKASPKFKPVDAPQDGIDISKFDDTWYNSLSKLLTENVRKSEIGDIFHNLEIINFNYDRCLEQYLQYSLSEYYGVSVEQVRAVMSKLPIHRPYGSVGKLPWQQGEGAKVEFGRPTPASVASVSKELRTFTEQVHDDGALEAIRRAVSTADRVVFLGFGFHRQNVQLIAASVQSHAEILGTAKAISGSDRSVIQDELWKALELRGLYEVSRIELADMTCNEFFKEYWRTLTAEPSDLEHEDMQFGLR